MNDESYFLLHIQQNEISHKSLLLLYVDSDDKDNDKNFKAS